MTGGRVVQHEPFLNSGLNSVRSGSFAVARQNSQRCAMLGERRGQASISLLSLSREASNSAKQQDLPLPGLKQATFAECVSFEVSSLPEDFVTIDDWQMHLSGCGHPHVDDLP